MNRVLIIGHDASRSGAPIVLMRFLEWLRARHREAEIDLLLLRGGELELEYRRSADVYTLPPRSPIQKLRDRARAKLGRPFLAPDSMPPFQKEYDTVLGNTVATLEHLALFRTRGFRTLCWQHELGGVVSSFYTRERFLELAALVDGFIACSGAVKHYLEGVGIAAPIHIAYEFSPVGEPSENTADVRRELGIPANAFVVGGGGTIERRKGPDLFVEAARRAIASRDDVYFIWTGGPTPSSAKEHADIERDIRNHGLAERIKFTGLTSEPENYLAAINVFASTSREDPFPLICLEAAGFGKPIIYFEKAGGMTEFVGNDAGRIVPYEDTEAFAEAILEYAERPEAARRAGEAARQKLRGDFSAERSCRTIEKILLGP